MLIHEIYEILELRNKVELSFRDIEESYQNIHARLIKDKDRRKLALKELKEVYELCERLFCQDLSFYEANDKSVDIFADFVVFLEQSLKECPKEDLWKIEGFTKSCLQNNKQLTLESKSIMSAATVSSRLRDILNELCVTPYPINFKKSLACESAKSTRKEVIKNNLQLSVKRKWPKKKGPKPNLSDDKLNYWNQLANKSKFSTLSKEIQDEFDQGGGGLRELFDKKSCNERVKKRILYVFQAAKLESYVKQRSRQSGYLHWYGRFFGYHRDDKVSAANKLRACLTGDGDFRALFESLGITERKALNQGELGNIYEQCWQIMCDPVKHSLPSSNEFIRPQ